MPIHGNIYWNAKFNFLNITFKMWHVILLCHILKVIFKKWNFAFQQMLPCIGIGRNTNCRFQIIRTSTNSTKNAQTPIFHRKCTSPTLITPRKNNNFHQNNIAPTSTTAETQCSQKTHYALKTPAHPPATRNAIWFAPIWAVSHVWYKVQGDEHNPHIGNCLSSEIEQFVCGRGVVAAASPRFL